MATRGTINELYDLKSLEGQQQAVLAFLKQYVDSVKAANGVQVQLGSAKGAKETAAAIKQLNAEQQKLADLQLKIAKAETEYAKARLNSNKADTQSIKTKKEQAALEQKLAKEKERLINAGEKEAKSIEKANNEYIKLNEQYKIASAASLKRGAELLKEAAGNELLFKSLLKTDKEYVATTKSANDYQRQLLLLEQNVGRSQRNVGNYASAFNGLNNSFGQIARELPALAINFQTFALAISNNLPIAIDEIQKAKAEIAKLRAEGLQAPSMFKQITGAIFSFQVGISIAITAFTLLAPKIATFFDELFKGKKIIDEATASTDALNKAYQDDSVKQAVNSVADLTTKVDLAKKGLINKEKVVKEYNETMGKTTGTVKSLDEVEQQLIKNGPAYIRMTILKAAAETARKEAGDKVLAALKIQTQDAGEFVSDIEKGFNSLNKLGSIGSSGSEKQADVNNEKAIARAAVRSVVRKRAAQRQAEQEAKVYEDLANSLINQAAKISKSFGFDFFGGEFDPDKDKGADNIRKNLEEEFKARREAIIKTLEENADFQKSIIDDENKSYEERLKAAENFFLVQDALASANKTTELIELKKKQDELKLSDEQIAEQRFLIEQKYSITVLKNVRENAALVTNIQKEQLEEVDRLRTEYEAKERKRVEDAFANNKTLLDKERDEQLLALENQFTDGVITRKQYEEEKERIQTEFNTRSLQVELQYYADLVALLKSMGADTTEAEAKIAAIRLKIKTGTNDKLLKADKEYADKLKQLYKELEDQVFNLAKTFTLGRFDAAKNAIQEQIDKTEEQKRKEIDAINATTLSAVEKQARITNAERQAQNERERLELRQRQLSIQRARFERAFNIASIVQSTGLAVMAALGKKPYTAQNIQLAILTGAIGATQLATALATPIPKFKTGKGQYDKYEGPAWVGDGGKSEVIFRENGSVEKTKATPTLTWVGKNDIIHPDADSLLNHTLKNQGGVFSYSAPANYQFDEINATLMNGFSSLQKTVQNKRETYFNINNGKPSITTKDGNRWKKYLNDNLQFGGKD
jgi:hypothetical protein